MAASEKTTTQTEGKRKRKRKDPFLAMYEDIEIGSRPSTDRPGTPHSFFSSSHNLLFSHTSSSDSEENQTINRQVVHCHANGLVVVTMGDKQCEDCSNIQSIVYHVEPTSTTVSMNERRKRTAKLAKGKTIPGSVTPTTLLATIQFKDGSSQKAYAGVWGCLLEINKNLKEAQDVLLDGYLAIIQPAGFFPPKILQQREINKEEDVTKETRIKKTKQDGEHKEA
mmetsp:Transcript_19715/g.29256  ORF Transcript_19715/g.29256 Transcript_19715/m.29256 type:complete len:224 (-) Transcript_19715:25-696(-)